MKNKEKTYKVECTFTFKGHFLVKCEDSREAFDSVSKHSGLIMKGGIVTTMGDDIDWEYPVHAEKKIGEIELL
jgi:hypothetical protein